MISVVWSHDLLQHYMEYKLYTYAQSLLFRLNYTVLIFHFTILKF